ncbi:MAG: mechanosensitive ion channel [Cyclobacteriaceae bacterium]
MDKYLTFDYWQQYIDLLISWSVKTVPMLIISLIVLFIVLRLINAALNSINKVILAKISEEEDLEGEKRAKTLLGILKGILKVTVWSIFILIFLKQLGLNIGPILAGAGILGLAVGFGAQELVRDIISGFFLLLENHIRAGDVVNINGTGGLVESIQLRTVRLRDFAGVVHVFQNGKINTIANMTKEWSACVFDIGVAYKEDLDRVMDIMQQVGDEMKANDEFKDLIISPIEIMGLDSFGDSALVIKARLKTLPGQQWFLSRAYRRRLKIVFDKENIEIPFPHQTIYWGDEISPLKVESKQQ